MKPKIDPSCYVHPSAVIIGNVTIEKNCSIWPNAVIRGDENSILIKEGTNIQDCSVIHADKDHPVIIGKDVTVGHGAIVHGAIVEDKCLIGMHATVLSGSKIGRGSIVGAGALVTENKEIPESSLVVGIPGKIIKKDKNFSQYTSENAKIYIDLARKYKDKLF